MFYGLHFNLTISSLLMMIHLCVPRARFRYKRSLTRPGHILKVPLRTQSHVPFVSMTEAVLQLSLKSDLPVLMVLNGFARDGRPSNYTNVTA